MLERMMDQQFMLYVLTGVSAAVLLQKIIVSLLYRHLRKETDALPAVNDRWMKQLKMKFENTYKVNNQIADVGVFVDRQVAKLRFFKLGLYGLNTFYRKAQLICIFLGGCSYVLAARAGRTTADCNIFFFMGILASVFIQFLDNLSGNSHSVDIVKMNITDYFENMLLPKLSQEQGSGGTAYAAAGGVVYAPGGTEYDAGKGAGYASGGVNYDAGEAGYPSSGTGTAYAEGGSSGDANERVARRMEPEAVKLSGKMADRSNGRTAEIFSSGTEEKRTKEGTPGKRDPRQRQKEEIAVADIQKRLSRISGSKLSREEEDRIVRDVLKEFLT